MVAQRLPEGEVVGQTGVVGGLREAVAEPPAELRHVPVARVHHDERGLQPLLEAARSSRRGCIVRSVHRIADRVGAVALHLVQVNLKAGDDAALGRFWAQALGWEASSAEAGATSVRPTGSGWPVPSAVCLDVIAVADPATVRDRAHLELATASPASAADLVARLGELGATPVDIGQGEVPGTVLADPEGNAFCVREPQDSYRDTGPIAAVVVDCADPRALSRFWGGAMGWTVHELADDRALLRSAEGVGPYLELLRTPHLAGGGGRLHLDLLPDPVEDGAEEVARLQALGATAADVGQGEVSWTVLADPEGHAFCVLGRG